jgi:hypothetical protein
MPTKSTPTGPADTRTGARQAETVDRGTGRAEAPLRGTTQPDPSAKTTTSNRRTSKAKKVADPQAKAAAKKAAPVKRYLVTRTVGLTTGDGHIAAGEYVTEEQLAGSVRRMLRTGAIVDLDPGTTAAPKTRAAAAVDVPEPSPDVAPAPTLAARLTAEAAAADLPTLAADSDADGVVAQTIPVVLRFLHAHPERGGDILAAERKRSKSRRSVVDAAKEAATATRGVNK